MANPYCDIFPPSPTDDSRAITFGYIRKAPTLSRPRRQILEVSRQMYDAYHAEQWAVFPTLDCLMGYVTQLMDLHLELDGKRRVTREDVEGRIRQVKTSVGANEEFTLLVREGFKLPGIPRSIRLPLPIDPEIVWSFETARYQSVLDSWTSLTESSGPVVKEARDQLEAAEWLDILTDVEEYRDWNCGVSLRPEWIKLLREMPQTPPPE